MNLTLLQTEIKTMSSREIATLCEKEHRHVLRDIRAYVGAVVQMERGIDVRSMDWEGKEGVELFGHTPVGGVTASYEINEQNKQSYGIYHLDKNATLTIVSGYNVLLRKRIIDRWQALESQKPKELTRMDLIQLAYEAEQERLALEHKVSELQPKADALDVISVASTSLNIRETAKTVGIQEKKFIAWCINHDWLYRDKKEKLCPVSHRIQNGFLEQRAVSYAKPNGGIGISTQAMFTGKALTHLANIFAIVKEVA